MITHRQNVENSSLRPSSAPQYLQPSYEVGLDKMALDFQEIIQHDETPKPEFMVGNCHAMMDVFYRIRRFAQCDAPVLISGETGTGKELAAQAVHQRSSRNKGPFVAINCAALPASLIASELFGYEKGAFTGAVGRKIGLIEQANNGTLFLDEIADLPLDLQGHLLRFLQEQTIMRIGGHTPIRVNARIISASHVPLENATASGMFRDDLFYRLNVLPLHMPALREREGDIGLLAAFFLQKIAGEFGRKIEGFTTETQSAIQTYAWPGNVREMIAAIRRAVVMGTETLISPADLAIPLRREVPAQVKPSPKMAAPKMRPGSEQERTALQQALTRNRQNITKTAAELGVSRVTLYRMVKRSGRDMETLPSLDRHGNAEYSTLFGAGPKAD
jgi:transcriptional regulator with PAS, ATPase and Fis domain